MLRAARHRGLREIQARENQECGGIVVPRRPQTRETFERVMNHTSTTGSINLGVMRGCSSRRPSTCLVGMIEDADSSEGDEEKKEDEEDAKLAGMVSRLLDYGEEGTFRHVVSFM